MKDENGDLSYLVSMNSTQCLTDHLGSVVAITDESGTLTSQQRYLPFGGIRTNVTSLNSPSTDYGYTGQRNLDEDIGLMDYKARFYSPVLNRFIQPDTLVPDPTNPVSWNRYTYVGNNPINFNDPDGRCYPICTAVIGAALGAIVGAVAYTATNSGDSFNATEMLLAAGAGAIAGGLIGTGVGILAGGAATASIAAATPYVLSSGVAIATTGGSYINDNKNKFDSKDFAIQTTIAGATAAITANPAMKFSSRYLTNLVGAEASYFLTEENPNFTGFVSVATSTTIMSGLDLAAHQLSYNYLYMENDYYDMRVPNNPKLNVQEGVIGSVNGAIVGFITPGANKIKSFLNKKFQME